MLVHPIADSDRNAAIAFWSDVGSGMDIIDKAFNIRTSFNIAGYLQQMPAAIRYGKVIGFDIAQLNSLDQGQQ